MNRKPLFIAIACAALVAAIALLYLDARSGDPAIFAAPDVTPSVLDEPASEAPAGTTPPPPPRVSSFVLPAADAPLVRAIPDLQAHADAGERQAACRLGLELIRCTQLRAWRDATAANSDKAEADLEAEGYLFAANAVAEEKIWQIEHLAQCEKLPASLRSQGVKYLRQAALAGDPYAMLAYAEGVHFDPAGQGIAVGADFDRWRQEAPRMVQAALQSGNPQAAYSLFLAYSEDSGLFTGVVPNDPYRTFVHHLLVVRLFGHAEREFNGSGLDADQRARARRDAADIHQRHFKNRRYAMSATRDPLMLRKLHPTGPEELCADPS